MRRIVCLLCLLGLVCGLISAAGAETLPLIQDDANLLTEAERKSLEQDMMPLCDYGLPMFWTTRESGDIGVLAEDFLRKHLARGESGTVFAINMQTRQLYIYSDGEIYRVVNGGEAETITDNVYRQAGRGDYYGCASSAFQQMYRLMNGEKIARPMKIISNALLSLVIALLAEYLYTSARYETHAQEGTTAALPVAAATAAGFTVHNIAANARMTSQRKTTISSGSGGGGGHGGGFSGGGGGGGHSGGGGGHGF